MKKDAFENFLITHFGPHIELVFSNFDEDDGYSDEIINAMWIGFNGGYDLGQLIPGDC